MGIVMAAKAAPTDSLGVKTPVLVNLALLLIHRALSNARTPAVAWSAGKDSQVMLHLIRQVRPDIPVLHIRGFADSQKHSFADSEIERLGLNLIQAQPFGTDVVAKGDHVEIVEAYRLSEGLAFYLPIEAEPDHTPGPSSQCAVKKINQPTNDEPIGVDCIFIGHRSDDDDPVYGAIPLERDTVEVGGVTVVYPLKNWTEANIWEATNMLGVSQNKARYERNEMEANPDYFPMCTKCLEPSNQEAIICPKIGEQVYSFGKYLHLEERREEWRSKFVNLQE